ncbi:MAG: hypothetical protein HY651_02850 [Acidobacteria bacterium]|nr:hypothetical protein [Acidobacteriota bacterium]
MKKCSGVEHSVGRATSNRSASCCRIPSRASRRRTRTFIWTISGGVGDQVLVKVINIQGYRIHLSRKAVLRE